MARKLNIGKILFLTFWCLVGAGVIVLLGAAMSYRSNKTCKGYSIELTGNSGSSASSGYHASSPFVDRKEIESLLTAAGGGKLQGRAIHSFDLRRLEAALEKNPWIKNAQLFFDNNEVLKISVTERMPVARIFTTDGHSFYIDSNGTQLPLSDKKVARLPVFTDYPVLPAHIHGGDSLLVRQVSALGSFIASDSFWAAQIAQIDITPARTFEMAPVIGNHLINFGDGKDYTDKFHRLFIFYKDVLSRTGFDKYSRIDVQYTGQVVGTRKGSEGTRFDSLQGIRNIQQLIKNARQLPGDSLQGRDTKPLEGNTVTEQTLTNYDLIPDSGNNRASSENTVPPDNAGPTARPATTRAEPTGSGNRSGTNGKPGSNIRTNTDGKPGANRRPGAQAASHGGHTGKPGTATAAAPAKHAGTSGNHTGSKPSPQGTGQQPPGGKQPKALMPAKQ